MSDVRAFEVWKQILAVLEDKLQFGFLEQARDVVDLKLEAQELTLFVCSQSAREFFSAEVNQQRILIVSRPIAPINSVVVESVLSSPIV